MVKSYRTIEEQKNYDLIKSSEWRKTHKKEVKDYRESHKEEIYLTTKNMKK